MFFRITKKYQSQFQQYVFKTFAIFQCFWSSIGKKFVLQWWHKKSLVVAPCWSNRPKTVLIALYINRGVSFTEITWNFKRVANLLLFKIWCQYFTITFTQIIESHQLHYIYMYINIYRPHGKESNHWGHKKLILLKLIN